MRVLLIDDNEDDAALVREMLASTKAEHCDLQWADRFSLGLSRLGKESFDVVLLDLSLPDSCGLETLQKVHSLSLEVPIIVLTGLDDDAVGVQTVQLGAQDYLVKGHFDDSLLVRSLRYAIERKRTEKHIRVQRQRLAIHQEIGQATAATLDLGDILDILMQKIDLLLPYSAALVWLKDRDSGVVERAACWNLDEAEWKGRKLPKTPELVQSVIDTKAPVVVDNIQTHPRTLDANFYRKHGLISYLAVPLLTQGEVLGVLVFLTREPHQFTEDEIMFLYTLAGQTGMAIHNCQLYAQTKKQAEELEEASKLQADFTAMIAHDLRSPLINVIAVGEMMNDGLFGPVSDEQKKWLERVVKSGRDLVDLVSDFLDVSKLEAGHVELMKEKVELEYLLRSTLDNHQILARDERLSSRTPFSLSFSKSTLIPAGSSRFSTTFSATL